MKIKLTMLLLSILLISPYAKGQQKAREQVTTYYLPDGTRLPKEKLDSATRSWPFGYNMDKRFIGEDSVEIHLVLITKEMESKQKADAANRTLTLKAMINQPAKDFTLSDMMGNRYTLSKLRGKIIVLNFWFTTCSPCIQEMPALNELTTRYDSSKVVFLALTFNNGQTVNDFLDHHDFKFRILPRAELIAKLYGVPSYPTSFVIDQQGLISEAMTSSAEILTILSKNIDKLL